ncbi:hypothetical protein CICLE_v10033157mg [Citrus x clementina]|uniref:Uncharacterized protein n=1 Tax=Citrus clementina TaxID=85681 RepID=V4TG49_CITCL|nr:hypothetical protein CICLE_v10033157mg [Citrus x clementina]
MYTLFLCTQDSFSLFIAQQPNPKLSTKWSNCGPIRTCTSSIMPEDRQRIAGAEQIRSLLECCEHMNYRAGILPYPFVPGCQRGYHSTWTTISSHVFQHSNN